MFSLKENKETSFYPTNENKKKKNQINKQTKKMKLLHFQLPPKAMTLLQYSNVLSFCLFIKISSFIH